MSPALAGKFLTPRATWGAQTTITANSRTFPSSGKGPWAHWQSLPFLPPRHPSPWQPLIYLLFLWIGLFWTFHISRTIQYVVFCNWLLSLSMFSRLIRVVLQSLLWPNNIPLYRYATFYPFINWWTFELFLLFGNYEQGCCEYLCKSLCMDICFQPSWVYTSKPFLGHMVITVCNT